MRTHDAVEFLTAAITNKAPVLCVGGPGVGKTDVIGQAATRAGAGLIVTHPGLEDPTDIKGLPWIAPGAERATFLPFGELARAIACTSLTVWDIEDLGQATPAVQAAYMPLLLARRVNGHVLPDCVTFVASTNRRTDRAGVTGILEPVKSRFPTIVEIEPHVDDWSEWMLRQTWLPEELAALMVAFMRFRPGLLYAFQPSADITNSPTPRTWANAARMLTLGLSPHVEREAVKGAVGEAAAIELLGFLRTFRELPSIDGILLDPEHGAIPTEPGVLYAVTGALASRVTPSNIGRIAKYAQRLVDKGYGEFAAILMRDCMRRGGNAVTATADFVRVVSGPLGKMIGGGSR